MDPYTVALVIGMPILIVAISAFLRYPFEEMGVDRPRAFDGFRSDVGLDIYLVGVTTLIGSTVARYGASIPESSWIVIAILALLSTFVARLYAVPWIEKRNLCLYFGLICGMICFGLAFAQLILA